MEGELYVVKRKDGKIIPNTEAKTAEGAQQRLRGIYDNQYDWPYFESVGCRIAHMKVAIRGGAQEEITEGSMVLRHNIQELEDTKPRELPPPPQDPPREEEKPEKVRQKPGPKPKPKGE